MSTENKGGKSQSMDSCPSVAITTLDGSAPSAAGGEPSSHTEKEECAPPSILDGRASNNEAHQLDGLSAVRRQLGARGVSEEGTEIIMASWKPGTEKQYSPHIKRWSQFCGRGTLIPLLPLLPTSYIFCHTLFTEVWAMKVFTRQGEHSQP